MSVTIVPLYSLRLKYILVTEIVSFNLVSVIETTKDFKLEVLTKLVIHLPLNQKHLNDDSIKFKLYLELLFPNTFDEAFKWYT